MKKSNLKSTCLSIVKLTSLCIREKRFRPTYFTALFEKAFELCNGNILTFPLIFLYAYAF